MTKKFTIVNRNTHETVDTLLKQQGLADTVDFHCREGLCGTCKMKKIQGEIQYVKEPLAFLDDNEFTPCVAKIIGSDDLIIETF